MSGFFITFEGGEGSGKSTQVALLAEHLRQIGYRVVTTREPGGSPAADIIRHVVLSGAAEELGREAEAMLLFAARFDHLRTVIEPALEKGRIVICDRFHDSTHVYQFPENARDGERSLRRRLERAVLSVTPDLTVILDVPASVGNSRARLRRGQVAADRFEREAEELQEARRQAFLRIATEESDRCFVVDGALRTEDVSEQILQIVSDRIQASRVDAVTRSLSLDRSS